MQRITTNALRDSIQHAMDHREAALEYAMQFARDLDPNLANRFVGMYVNERTLNYGEDGREAIRKILSMGYERGIISREAHVDFVGLALHSPEIHNRAVVNYPQCGSPSAHSLAD